MLEGLWRLWDDALGRIVTGGVSRNCGINHRGGEGEQRMMVTGEQAIELECCRYRPGTRGSEFVAIWATFKY